MENIASYLKWRGRRDEDEIFAAFAASYGQGHTVFNFPPTDSPHFTQRGTKTWLRRIYREERALAQNILRRLGRRPPPPVAVPAALNEGQQRAFRAALASNFLIINGGPGTGKTYTLAQLVHGLRRQRPDLSIALCAPTGKAAQRMAESLAQQNVANLEEAQTVHRLIGYSSGAVLHDEKNPLPQQLIIVDEASMLSSALAQQLFAAVAPGSQLILLGDGRQLAAVEPGAVLNDLINNEFLRDYVVTLEESRRFSTASAIGGLVRELQREPPPLKNIFRWARALAWREQCDYGQLFAGYEPYLAALAAGAEHLLAAFDDFRVLTTMNRGPWGTVAINRELARLHCQRLGLAPAEFFHGLPLMVLANDYQLNLFNGDIGLCLGQGEELQVQFPQKTVALRHLNPAQLAPAYALTIHKAQGSEFRRVALVLQDSERLLSRELLYTGVSRAREELQLYASRWALARACQRPIRRQTGLNYLFAELEGERPAHGN